VSVPGELFRSTEHADALSAGSAAIERVITAPKVDELLDALERSLYGEIAPDEIVALLKEWGR
jgi:hypothetical protein